jgi:hypothetical protein
MLSMGQLLLNIATLLDVTCARGIIHVACKQLRGKSQLNAGCSLGVGGEGGRVHVYSNIQIGEDRDA